MVSVAIPSSRANSTIPFNLPVRQNFHMYSISLKSRLHVPILPWIRINFRCYFVFSQNNWKKPRRCSKPRMLSLHPKNCSSLVSWLVQEVSIMRYRIRSVETITECLLTFFFSTENPCPELGNIMTIKLSENKVTVPQSDGTFRTMNVEMHFQMNYNTGKWNWIEKRREVDTSTLSSLAAVAAAAANNEQFTQQHQQLASWSIPPSSPVCVH